jgi:hypothetical protein
VNGVNRCMGTNILQTLTSSCEWDEINYLKFGDNITSSVDLCSKYNVVVCCVLCECYKYELEMCDDWLFVMKMLWCVILYKDVVEFVGRHLEMERRMIFCFASPTKLSHRTCVFWFGGKRVCVLNNVEIKNMSLWWEML